MKLGKRIPGQKHLMAFIIWDFYLMGKNRSLQCLKHGNNKIKVVFKRSFHCSTCNGLERNMVGGIWPFCFVALVRKWTRVDPMVIDKSK